VAPAALLALSAVLSFAHPGRSAPPPVGLIAKEFSFDPKDITVRPGEVAFVVKNQGALEHNLVLEILGGKTVTQMVIIEPGETRRVTASLPAGIYAIYCSLPGHRDAGMVATLRVSPSLVSEPPTTAPSSPAPAPQSPALSPPGLKTAPSNPAPPPRSLALSPSGPTTARAQAAEPAAHPAAPSAAPVGRPEFHVQAGAFRQREYADELAQQLRAKGYTVTLVGGPLLRVWVGPAMSRAAAERLVANLRSNGFEAMLKPVKSEAPTVEAPRAAPQGAPSVEQACADFKAWFEKVEPRVRQIYSRIGCSRGVVDTYWLSMEVRDEEWILLTHDQRLTLTKLFWEAWVNVADHEHPDKDFISLRSQAGEDRGGGGLGTLHVKGGLE
jgi:uncharacterized cupredoxin-like copper-binding protein